MEKTSIVHITLAGAIGALAAYFNILLVPLIVLTVVMAVDYLTGMFSASREGKLNSRTGVIGLIKKVGYLALVGVGMVVDYLMTSALAQIGVNSGMPNLFGLMVIIWLIINELISILENLGEIGVPLPSFLVNAVKSLKNKVDSESGKHYLIDKDDKEE